MFNASWQVRLSLILIPAAAYLVMALSLTYPQTERVTSNVSTAEMWKQATRPLVLILFVCMWMTAAVEIGPDQWFPRSWASRPAAQPGEPAAACCFSSTPRA